MSTVAKWVSYKYRLAHK